MEVDGDVTVVTEHLAGRRDRLDDAVDLGDGGDRLIRPDAFILTAVRRLLDLLADVVGDLSGLVARTQP